MDFYTLYYITAPTSSFIPLPPLRFGLTDGAQYLFCRLSYAVWKTKARAIIYKGGACYTRLFISFSLPKGGQYVCSTIITSVSLIS